MHKITTKRQVTLPQAVCNAMALQPCDYVEIFARDGVAHIIKMNSDNLAGKFNYLIKDREFPSAEEMKNAIKKHVADKFATDDCN
jgi:bifunctional DNA-binding transcriptional regulator/antitoxin component of YhaV-PrlF toxin-antitoxin module